MLSARKTVLLFAVLLQACVTAGSGEQAAIGGAVLVFSHLARSAQSGDQTAKRSWCEAFTLVQERAAQTDASLKTDEQLTEELTPEMHTLMRKHGYSLHRQQIGIVIKDALNVSRNPNALNAMMQSCS